MAETSIEWTDHSINPLRARHRDTGAVGHYCEKISSGCANCYASRLQSRFQMPPFPGAKGTTVGRGPSDEIIVNDQIEVWLDESKLHEVMRRKKPTRYFWCDMTDMFGWWVRDAWILKCFAAMVATPHHTHMVLSKRADRMAELVPQLFDELFGKQLRFGQGDRVLVDHTNSYLVPPNIWLGTSAENQRAADQRVPKLLECPSAVRFVSAEPLLEEIDFTPWLFSSDGFVSTPENGPIHRDDGGVALDWIIVGGESGLGARPCNEHWIGSIVEQCRDSGSAAFVKQMGANVVTNYRDGNLPKGKVKLRLRDSKGANPEEWREDLRVREYPRERLGAKHG